VPRSPGGLAWSVEGATGTGRTLAVLRVLSLTLLLAGCGSVLPERGAQSYFRFDDGAPRPSARAQPLARSVVVAPISSNAVGNAYGMLYSRASGERAFYQNNEWTDRPTLRVAQLL